MSNRVNDQRRTAKPLVAALLAGGLAAAAGAASANLVMYGQEGFRGRSFVVSGEIADLDATRWNDRASSIVVESGVWEVCSDSHFRGSCTRLGPGDYPTLGSIGDRISSVRRLRQTSEYRDDWRDHRRWDDRWRERSEPSVTLYSQYNLGGRAMSVDRTMRNLDETPFNDRARSVVVQEGVWEMCTDARFSGDCYRLGPGRYDSLPGNLAGKLSSLRRIG